MFTLVAGGVIYENFPTYDDASSYVSELPDDVTAWTIAEAEDEEDGGAI
jgi:hypothetical protein